MANCAAALTSYDAQSWYRIESRRGCWWPPSQMAHHLCLFDLQKSWAQLLWDAALYWQVATHLALADWWGQMALTCLTAAPSIPALYLHEVYAASSSLSSCARRSALIHVERIPKSFNSIIWSCSKYCATKSWAWGDARSLCELALFGRRCSRRRLASTTCHCSIWGSVSQCSRKCPILFRRIVIGKCATFRSARS